MKIDKSTFDDHAVLTLKGEFDTFYCPSLQQEVEALVDRGINPDETRNKMLGQKRATLVGTMANVDGSKAQFLWNGTKTGLSVDQAKTLFFKDGEVHLKFQVKMIKKSFFELRGKVTQTEAAEDGGIRVTVHFAGIDASDRDALSQFAEDMAFLKRQLPG